MTLPSGAFENKHYIYANAATPVALFTMRSNGSNDMRFFHYDNLMSVDTITNSNAGVVENLSFDTYGLRRNPDWTSAATPIMSLTDHGYTNHEHIDTFGLIDMKGRMYDPSIGRFMSADPYVPDPLLSESFNRYSYVNNNPTSFIDPTGFQGTCPGPAVIVCGGISAGINTAVGAAALSAIGSTLSYIAATPTYSGGGAPASPAPIATHIAATPTYQGGQGGPSPEMRRVMELVQENTNQILYNLPPLSVEEKEWVRLMNEFRNLMEEMRQVGVPLYQLPFPEATDPGTIKDQFLADLEKLANSYDEIPAMGGQMALELYEARQRGASTAERISIALTWSTKVFSKVLSKHRSTISKGRIQVTLPETKSILGTQPYAPYSSPMKLGSRGKTN